MKRVSAMLSLPPRFDRLRTRLFLAIAGTNALLAVLAWLVFSWSFDRGLVDYLNRADTERLQPLVQRLADHYREEGSWHSLTGDAERWTALLAETPAPGRNRHQRLERAWRDRGLSEDDIVQRRQWRRAAADARLLLIDVDGRVVQGPARQAGNALREPIAVDGRVVGWLGHVPRLKMVESLERAFVAAQIRRFAWIAIGMLVAGLLVSALLAEWLTRRIRSLERGTAALMRGEYVTRIEVSGYDELATLAHDFNRLAQTLEAARRARQQWIADIAHELRTPLSVLRAEIEALQDGIRPLDMHGLASLAQEVEQLTRLVQDLHVLSLSDLGALDYQHQPLDLTQLVREALAQHDRLLADAGLALDLVLEDDVRVTGDRARLLQVLGNLLQNSVRYTRAPGRLQVRLSRCGNAAHLVWQDSSPGVAADDLPRLTERLFRADGARARAAGSGSGLGLAIARAIVEAHQGTMQPSASPLGGLCWTVTLPLLPPGSAAVE